MQDMLSFSLYFLVLHLFQFSVTQQINELEQPLELVSWSVISVLVIFFSCRVNVEPYALINQTNHSVVLTNSFRDVLFARFGIPRTNSMLSRAWQRLCFL